MSPNLHFHYLSTISPFSLFPLQPLHRHKSDEYTGINIFYWTQPPTPIGKLSGKLYDQPTSMSSLWDCLNDSSLILNSRLWNLKHNIEYCVLLVAEDVLVSDRQSCWICFQYYSSLPIQNCEKMLYLFEPLIWLDAQNLNHGKGRLLNLRKPLPGSG